MRRIVCVRKPILSKLTKRMLDVNTKPQRRKDAKGAKKNMRSGAKPGIERLRLFLPSLLAVFIALAMLSIYLRTLMPGTVGGDAGELQYAAPLLALVHPTGQPLYVLLGKVWTELLALRSAAYEMNLLSAVSAALGCGLLTWFIARLYNNLFAGILAGATLGLGATAWGQAVLADKYGFNVLLAVIIVGLTLWWDQARRENMPDASSDRILYVLSAAFAIGLLHHRSLALFAFGIGVLVIWHLRAELWQQWRRTLICAAIVLLPPLLVYPTVLPALRANEVSPLLWQPTSANDWLDFLLERHVLSTEALVFDDTESISQQLTIYAETVSNDYTLIVPLVALVGLLLMFRKHPGGAVFLLVSYALQAFLSANFRGNERQFTYYLPSFVVLIYAYAYGIVSVLQGMVLQGMNPGNLRRMAIPAVFALVVLSVPLQQLAATYIPYREAALYGESLGLWRETLKSGDMGARVAQGMHDLPQNAALASDWEQVTILWYEQQVENVRPDLEIFYPIERYADYADDAEKPICLARHVPVGENWHPTNVGALICLNREPNFTLPDDLSPLNTALYTLDGEPRFELAGYNLASGTIPAGAHTPLSLTWRALADIPADYSVSLQVLDESWNPVWSRDIQNPVMGMYPTSRWIEGEIVQDYHEISLPRDLPPGRYSWTVVVYRVLEDGTFEQLRNEADQINILGGTFEVIPG